MIIEQPIQTKFKGSKSSFTYQVIKPKHFFDEKLVSNVKQKEMADLQ